MTKREKGSCGLQVTDHVKRELRHEPGGRNLNTDHGGRPQVEMASHTPY